MEIPCPSCQTTCSVKDTKGLSKDSSYVKCCYHIWDIFQSIQKETSKIDGSNCPLQKNNLSDRVHDKKSSFRF